MGKPPPPPICSVRCRPFSRRCVFLSAPRRFICLFYLFSRFRCGHLLPHSRFLLCSSQSLRIRQFSVRFCASRASRLLRQGTPFPAGLNYISPLFWWRKIGWSCAPSRSLAYPCRDFSPSSRLILCDFPSGE